MQQIDWLWSAGFANFLSAKLTEFYQKYNSITKPGKNNHQVRTIWRWEQSPVILEQYSLEDNHQLRTISSENNIQVRTITRK